MFYDLGWYPQGKPTKAEMAQTFAVHIVTNTKKFDHITPVLQELVTAQGMKISYNLPFVELIPLSVPFLSFNKYLKLPLLNSGNSKSHSNSQNNVRLELFSI